MSDKFTIATIQWSSLFLSRTDRSVNLGEADSELPYGGSMDLPESEAVSFIVKIQLERAGHESGSTIWHGYITHVPSGERRYLKDLNDIIAFIVPYLKQLGVNFSRFWPLRMSLYCWKFLLQKE